MRGILDFFFVFLRCCKDVAKCLAVGRLQIYVIRDGYMHTQTKAIENREGGMKIGCEHGTYSPIFLLFQSESSGRRIQTVVIQCTEPWEDPENCTCFSRIHQLSRDG